MNYIQTLFSIFNAPLFATFIIAMFWRRATAWGGFFSMVAGTAAAYATNRLDAYQVIFHFGSALCVGASGRRSWPSSSTGRGGDRLARHHAEAHRGAERARLGADSGGGGRGERGRA